MNLLLSLINAAACGLISVALLGAILSPKVHDGIVIKIGLISMAAGFGAVALVLWEGLTAALVPSIERALLLINAGIAVAIVGYVIRRATSHHELRRSTDWAALMDTRPMERN